MKSAEDWLKDDGFMDECNTIAEYEAQAVWVRHIQADALEAAAKECDAVASDGQPSDHRCEAGRDCAVAVRKLKPKESA